MLINRRGLLCHKGYKKKDPLKRKNPLFNRADFTRCGDIYESGKLA